MEQHKDKNDDQIDEELEMYSSLDQQKVFMI